MRRMIASLTMTAVLAAAGAAAAQQPVTLAFATLSEGTAWYV